MTNSELRELAIYAAQGQAPANFECADVDAAVADGFRELMGTVNQFKKNRYDIYDILIEAIDKAMPVNVLNRIGAFADVQFVANGQKAVFKRRVGKKRAKSFLTQVAINGVYETFRLDNEKFELAAHAVGGAAAVDLQRLVDGAESLSEYMDIILQGLDDAIFVEVQKAMVAAFTASNRPAANKKQVAGWDAEKMVELVNVVRAYGSEAIIYACPEFVAKMGADAIVPAISGVAQGIYSPADIEAIHNVGYINLFRGTPVVRMPQSFIDEENYNTYLNPQYAYVMPTGGEKVVKVVIEGPTMIRDYENRDGSFEIEAERKIGAAILWNHTWGIYQNTDITDTSKAVYENL